VPNPRVGLGFDVHPREDPGRPGRPLMLGGVEFEGEPGLAGHSDADVVCHAVADALLGARGLGDLGEHFPDTDPSLAGIGGLDLLGRVVGLVADESARPTSCDVTVIAERPSIGPRRDEMRRNLATAMDLDTSRVSVKGTRPEGLGLSGDGVGCLAVVLVSGP
jgi:2-C-methyl-D-erythritol 2,4-cyclodiphosphate synthase